MPKVLKDAFHIFTDPDNEGLTPRRVKGPQTRIHHRCPLMELVTAAMDGLCLREGCQHVGIGAGVYFGEGHPNNAMIRIPSTMLQSNNVGELVAIHKALRSTHPNAPLTILSDS
jgi:hypothetical protein